MRGGLRSVSCALEEMRAGRLVVLLGNAPGESSGALCLAADRVTPAAVNFMATHAGGLVCLALDEARVRQLGLPLMVAEADVDPARRRAFTVSIEARSGVSTGISAHDRARTIQVAVADSARASDLVRPGHVFPVLARRGGVLRWSGHVEAAVDLARIASTKPAGVVCEVLDEAGASPTRAYLLQLAARHGLPVLGIEDLLQHRLETSHCVWRVREGTVSTAVGEFHAIAYGNEMDGVEDLALIAGRISPQAPIPVTIHGECLGADVFGSRLCECNARLDASLARLRKVGSGVLLYLRRGNRIAGALNELREGGPAEARWDACASLRAPGVAAGILADLGVRRARLSRGQDAERRHLQRWGVDVSDDLKSASPRLSAITGASKLAL